MSNLVALIVKFMQDLQANLLGMVFGFSFTFQILHAHPEDEMKIPLQ